MWVHALDAVGRGQRTVKGAHDLVKTEKGKKAEKRKHRFEGRQHLGGCVCVGGAVSTQVPVLKALGVRVVFI